MRMNISMEKFNPGKHDSHLVATLIYAADREFNEIVYGNEAAGVAVIKKMMEMDHNYFTYPHVDCAVHNGEVTGVLVGFTGREKQQLDQGSAKAFARVFGFWSFLFKKIPVYMKMAKFTWNKIDEDKYLVNSLCVVPAHRSQGIGAHMLESVYEKYDKVYLDVNMHNEKALKFYQRNGFEIKSYNSIIYKGKKVGAYSIKRGS